ncbi:hypothetical protein CB1_001049009, partial [Camelus ferus]
MPLTEALASRPPALALPPARGSVQVSVAPAGLGGALSTVTIQAQQCLDGMWSVSRVNSFLPPSCLGSPPQAYQSVTHSSGMASVEPALATAPAGEGHSWPGGLWGTRQSFEETLVSGTCPLSDAPCALCRAETVSVKVMLRIWPAQGAQRSAESTSFLKVDPRKKQVTLYDPAVGTPGSSGPRRACSASIPKMFAFDAVFPQDSEQAEVCSGTVADVLQSVVGGADGCVFSFGHTSL